MRRHRANTVLESIRLNEIENVQKVEVERHNAQEKKNQAKVLTHKFLKRFEESGGKPFLSHELRAERDLSDCDSLSTEEDSRSDEYIGVDKYVPLFSSACEPVRRCQRVDEKFKKSCSLSEKTTACPGPVENDKQLRFFLSKKDDFECVSEKEPEKVEYKWPKGPNIDQGDLLRPKMSDKFPFSTIMPKLSRQAAPQCISSMPANGAKSFNPTSVKETISRHKPSVSGLQNMLARRMHCEEDQLLSTVSNQPVHTQGGPQSHEQAPPSGLVFSAKRYAAHKQASSTGLVLESKTMKINPVSTSTINPKKQDKELFQEKNVLSRENLPTQIVEFRSRPNIKPASHFTETRGPILRFKSQGQEVPGIESKKVPISNFGATCAIFESSKAVQTNYTQLLKVPRGSLFTAATDLQFSKVKTGVSKSSKTYNSKPAASKSPDLSSSIGYNTANSTAIIGDLDVSGVPYSPQPPRLIQMGPPKSSVMLRPGKVDTADFLATHFDTIVERTLMLEQSGKFTDTPNQTSANDPWVTVHSQKILRDLEWEADALGGFKESRW